MKNRIIIIVILAITLILVFYYIKQDKRIEFKTENKKENIDDNIRKTTVNFTTASEYLANDSLTKKYKYKIAKVFENGEPALVYFYENDSTSPVYQKMFTQLGKIYVEGKIKDRKRTGRWYSWYDDGSLWSTGCYKDGKDDGLTEAYYENGILRHSIQYKDGNKNGNAKYYNQKGELICEIMYSDNQIIERKDY